MGVYSRGIGLSVYFALVNTGGIICAFSLPYCHQMLNFCFRRSSKSWSWCHNFLNVLHLGLSDSWTIILLFVNNTIDSSTITPFHAWFSSQWEIWYCQFVRQMNFLHKQQMLRGFHGKNRKKKVSLYSCISPCSLFTPKTSSFLSLGHFLPSFFVLFFQRAMWTLLVASCVNQRSCLKLSAFGPFFSFDHKPGSTDTKSEGRSFLPEMNRRTEALTNRKTNGWKKRQMCRK